MTADPWTIEPPPVFPDFDDDPLDSPPDAATRSTWLPVDLGPILDGTHEPEIAELLLRTDGIGLLYRGRLHSLHGESESGKSLVAQAECARVLDAGGRVLYVDWESDAGSVVARLLALGAPPTAIRERLLYARPDTGLQRAPDLAALSAVLNGPRDLAVVDGVTEALAVIGGQEGTPEDRVARYVHKLPRRIARETGAAVLQIDHVTKSTDGRGRFALGSQHKMNSLDGAAYLVEVVQAIGVGLRGVIELRVAKDRPGSVRAQCGTWRQSDRTQLAARVVVDSTGDQTHVTVEPPTTRVGDPADTDRRGGFRPTLLMERVSRFLEGRPEPSSGREVTDGVSGKANAIRTALDVLADEGYITRTPGQRSSHQHLSARPYRQAEDPQSDAYTGGDAVDPQTGADRVPSTASPTASPLKGVGRSGTQSDGTADRVPGRSGTQSGRSGTQSLSGPETPPTTSDPWAADHLPEPGTESTP